MDLPGCLGSRIISQIEKNMFWRGVDIFCNSSCGRLDTEMGQHVAFQSRYRVQGTTHLKDENSYEIGPTFAQRQRL